MDFTQVSKCALFKLHVTCYIFQKILKLTPPDKMLAHKHETFLFVDSIKDTQENYNIYYSITVECAPPQNYY